MGDFIQCPESPAKPSVGHTPTVAVAAGGHGRGPWPRCSAVGLARKSRRRSGSRPRQWTTDERSGRQAGGSWPSRAGAGSANTRSSIRSSSRRSGRAYWITTPVTTGWPVAADDALFTDLSASAPTRPPGAPGAAKGGHRAADARNRRRDVRDQNQGPDAAPPLVPSHVHLPAPAARPPPARPPDHRLPSHSLTSPSTPSSGRLAEGSPPALRRRPHANTTASVRLCSRARSATLRGLPSPAQASLLFLGTEVSDYPDEAWKVLKRSAGHWLR